MSRIAFFSFPSPLPEGKPPAAGIPRPVGWIILVSLAVKLGLLHLNAGEYTDGIIQLRLWDSPVVFFPPGYSAAVWVVHVLTGDWLLAGRLVSIAASGITLLVFYRLALFLTTNENEALWATLFLALSPIFNRWSLRVMTDSLFLALFVWCAYQYVVLRADPQRSPFRLLGWTGVAALVRYQGLFFLPFALVWIWKRKETWEEAGSGRRAAGILGSFVPWLALGLWIGLRGFGHVEQFVERGSFSPWVTVTQYFLMFETFVLYWPWAVTYGLFILGAMGFVSLARTKGAGPWFVRFSAVAACVFLVAQSAFLSFQYRYMLPLLPLWCIAAARGWTVCGGRIENPRVRVGAGGLVLANLALMTAAVLLLQRATFGDLADSARFLASAKFQRVAPPGTRVLSDEFYREGVYNVKMRFWAGEEFLKQSSIEWYYGTTPRAGDVVIFHNTYTSLSAMETEKKRLEEKFDVSVLQIWRGQTWGGEYMTIPLLPDIMVNPASPPLTSNPQCMAFRFFPQYYYSVALLLKDKIPHGGADGGS
ncbi:MAG: ArnT family glycosyltransferase [bacterium]